MREEVWLRGNVRPVAGVAAAAATACAAVVVAMWAARAPAPLAWAVAAACGLLAAVVGGLAVAVAQPRLARRADVLRVRLAPLVVREVPLASVECFFLGSAALGERTAPRSGAWSRRVTTLVMRLAERAVDQHRRPTFATWGTWEDGSVVFDGRWCEPLSVDVARRLSGLLVEARRSAAGGGEAR